MYSIVKALSNLTKSHNEWRHSALQAHWWASSNICAAVSPDYWPLLSFVSEPKFCQESPGLGCHRTRITWLSKARWWPLLGGGGEGGQNTRHQCRGRVAIYQKMTEDALYGLAWFLGSDLGMKEKKSWSQIYSWGQWTLDTAEEEACKVTAARWHQGWVLTAECRGGYWVGLQISNLYLTTSIVVSYV